MNDLVKRLRRGADDASLDCYAMCEEAADRIEELEKALKVYTRGTGGQQPNDAVFPGFRGNNEA